MVEVQGQRLTDPRHCASCGGRLEPVEGHFVCGACRRPTYHNPRPCVAALVVHDGELLLVKRKRAPFEGWWDIPGGFLEPGEEPAAGVAREVREESGLEVEVARLVGVYPDAYEFRGETFATLSLYYECRVAGGVAAAGDDAADLGWFALDGLPEEIAFPSARRVLAEWRRAT